MSVNSVRRALSHLKKSIPDVVVAEFNFQSDFRDRTSNLESLMARLQRHPDTRVIVFYEQQYAAQFEKLRTRFPVFAALSYPISAADLARELSRAGEPG